jgi:hypothetical protein
MMSQDGGHVNTRRGAKVGRVIALSSSAHPRFVAPTLDTPKYTVYNLMLTPLHRNGGGYGHCAVVTARYQAQRR